MKLMYVVMINLHHYIGQLMLEVLRLEENIFFIEILGFVFKVYALASMAIS